MHILRLISIVSMLLFCGVALAQRWVPYSSTIDGFRLMAPGELEVEEIEYLSEYGIVVPARVYSIENAAGRFSVTVVDYRDSQKLHEERIKELDGVYLSVYGEVDVRGSIAYAAKHIRERASEVDYDAYHYINRVDGHQLQTTNPNQTRTFAAIYLRESRLYIVDATVSPGTPPPGMFQQSLEFLDEDGELIRYQNFSDVVKVTGVTRR